MRRTTSISSLSLKAAGAVRWRLSRKTCTSAMLRGGRVSVPPKMTSSISPPRICLAEISPITQRKASTMFDLPQPCGPTMPVRPGSMTSSVGSTKDLKPESLRRAKCSKAVFRAVGLLQERGQDAVEGLERQVALVLDAVDDEGGGRLHLELLLRLHLALED